MATKTECPMYSDCGFVKWRRERPDLHITLLPENGDCGKPTIDCGRLHSNNPIKVDTYGPQTREEFDIALKEIPNKNGRPPRRLVGGGHT